MRWFKHLSMAHEDEALSGVVEEMGVDGSRAYGIYWFLLEAVAGPMEKDCTAPQLTHSDLKWASICHCSVRVFRRIAERFASGNLIELKSIGNRTQISIPKLLKYRDEYSQRSGQAPDKLRPRSETDTDTEKDQIPTPPSPSSEGERVELKNGASPHAPPEPKHVSQIEREFEEDWPDFWVQIGKGDARKAYAKARRKVPRDALMAAVRAQGPPILQRAKAQGITPVHPATWLNQGRYEDNQRHLEGLAAVPARASPLMLSRKEKAREEFRERIERRAAEHESENPKLDYPAGS